MDMHPSRLTPKIVLGIAAHPDDLDFYAGGAMAAFAKQGADVYYLILTDGGKGSEDAAITPETLRDIRREEQRTAGEIIGLKDIFFCDYPDGTLENTHDVRRDVVRVIRQIKPDVVVALDPTIIYSAEHGFINHLDHRAAGQAAIDAVYPLARDRMSYPELLQEGCEPHKTQTLLLSCLNVRETSFAIDITETLETKYQALGAHKSQLSIQNLKAEIDKIAASSGHHHGYNYAESFERIDID